MEITADFILGLLGVLAPIIVALATWYTIRNGKEQIKVEKLKSTGTLSVEMLEKAGDLAFEIAKKSREDYVDCQERLDKAEKENVELTLARTGLVVRRKLRMAKLRELITDHNKMASDFNQEDCPGIDIMNQRIAAIISEMEKEEI